MRVNGGLHDRVPVLAVNAIAQAVPRNDNRAPTMYRLEAAAVASASVVLSNRFPASLSTLTAAYASSLAAIPNGPVKSAGIATGQAAAVAMIAARERRLEEITDGISDARVYGEIHFRTDQDAGAAREPHWRLHLQSQAPAGAWRGL